MRSNDVTLFPVLVMEQSDPRGPVRVVFDAGDVSRNVQLVPLEVDESISSLMAPPLCHEVILP
jgi:hypothetical protein